MISRRRFSGQFRANGTSGTLTGSVASVELGLELLEGALAAVESFAGCCDGAGGKVLLITPSGGSSRGAAIVGSAGTGDGV
jgi:hypothetical protein